MSKSLGNFWTIKEILEKVDPMVLRLALINAHYRSPIDMNEQLLADAEKNMVRIEDIYRKALLTAEEDPVQLPRADMTSQLPLARSLGLLEEMASDFAKAMDDDFNSREAIAKLLAAIREMSRMMSELNGDDLAAYAGFCVEWIEEHAGQVLGLLKHHDVILAEAEEDPRRAEISDKVEELLVKRAEVRAAKDWPAADAIRDELAAMGVVVTDTADGPTWDIQ